MSALSPSTSVKPAAKAALSVVAEFALAIFMGVLAAVGGLCILGPVAVVGGLVFAGLLDLGEAYYHGEDIRDEAIYSSRSYGVILVLLTPAMLAGAVYQQLSGEWAAAIPFLGMTVTAMAMFALTRVDPDDPVDFLRWSV